MEHDLIIITSGNKTLHKSVDPLIQALRSAAGRQALAASMVAPIRRQLNYHQISRYLMPVQQLPTGALPVYYKDGDDV